MDGGRELKNSTLTLYYQQRSQSARPTPSRVPAGPASKLIGGVHTHAYEDRPSASRRPAADAPSTSQAWGAPAGGGDTTTTTSRDTGRDTYARNSQDGSLYKTKKVVYWTGRDHHIVDAPDVAESARSHWVPPHLKQNDVAPGPQLAVRETPGACRVKLIASKYRYLPTMEPDGSSMWAVSPQEATLYGSVGSNTWGSGGMSGGRPRPSTAGPYGNSAEAYAAARQRIMGYKEYESSTKMLNGIGSWERTQRHLTNSMDVGRPSTMRSAAQQTANFTGLRALQ